MFFFVTGVGCEIGLVEATQSNNILYISVTVICTIKFDINKNFMNWMLNVLDRSNYLT